MRESETPVVAQVTGQQHGGVAGGLGRRQAAAHQGAAETGTGEFRGHGQRAQDQHLDQLARAVFAHRGGPEAQTASDRVTGQRHAAELGQRCPAGAQPFDGFQIGRGKGLGQQAGDGGGVLGPLGGYAEHDGLRQKRVQTHPCRESRVRARRLDRLVVAVWCAGSSWRRM
ncbi:MAG: hypothetical protein QGG75_07720 [Alphaproteobacteria bacterium]|nr:hypothetical protein [Alphaproteobacteria bacterium]